MTKQTGNDRYAGTTPQSHQQQSQGQSQSQSQNQSNNEAEGQSPGATQDGSAGRPSPQPNAANPPETVQAGGSQYEVKAPEHMPQDADSAARRQQAGVQSDHDPSQKGFGYGAQDGEEMSDAPDASERGYGGASEEREKKLDDSE